VASLGGCRLHCAGRVFARWNPCIVVIVADELIERVRSKFERSKDSCCSCCSMMILLIRFVSSSS